MNLKSMHVDLCVIGAGSGGLSVAAGAAQMGARVALIEHAAMGGECLNAGCVPSKAMLAAAKQIHHARHIARFGGQHTNFSVDYGAVQNHIRSTIQAIAPHDGQARFEGLGATVIRGHAHFVDPGTVAVNDLLISARRFVIATGSRAAIPPIEGLADVPYLTNETIFRLEAAPTHLLIIGGGPIGIEMAQAHARLGIKVTVIEAAVILPRDDGDARDVLRALLLKEGILIYEHSRIKDIKQTPKGVTAVFTTDGHVDQCLASHVLVAAGRQPNVADLDLNAAQVMFSPRGIEVDQGLKTSNKKIYAIGDVTGQFQFTHMASAQAATVLRNSLFRLPATFTPAVVPWVTYTDPEVAQVGMLEATALAQNIPHRVLYKDFSDNNRAVAEGGTSGFLKVITTPRGQVLGATCVGANAGEMIALWCLLIAQKKSVRSLAQVILPYPTRNELSKAVAGSFYSPQLFSTRTQKIVRFIQDFL